LLTKDKEILRHHVEEPAKLNYKQKKEYDNKQGGRKEGKYPSQLDIRNNK
jgi:hypothetical protein